MMTTYTSQDDLPANSGEPVDSLRPSTSRPLKYPGGKHYVTPFVIENLPPHLIYTEPFCGSAKTLLARDPGRDWLGDHKKPAHLRGAGEIINDANGSLTNFWRVLQDPDDFAEFARRVNVVPFSQVEFDEADPTMGSSVDRAVAYFIRNRMSHSGMGKGMAIVSRNRTRGGVLEQTNAWLSCVDDLPMIHARLRAVLVRNMDACDFIEKHDGPLVCHYCDPPYVHETRATKDLYSGHEMNREDHQRLLSTLASVAGSFVLSGYPNDLYDGVAERHGWRVIDREYDNKMTVGKSKSKKIERLWIGGKEVSK